MLVATFLGLAAAQAQAPEITPTPLRATAVLEGKSGSQTVGLATFTEDSPGAAPGVPGSTTPPVRVMIQLVDASPGNHAIFLHERPDCSAPDASGVGATLAPPSPGTGGAPEGAELQPGFGMPPMAPAGVPAGYLGFLTVSAEGRGEKELLVSGFTLRPGPASLLDRSIVVYERAPDLGAMSEAGARQACGVIRARAVPGTL